MIFRRFSYKPRVLLNSLKSVHSISSNLFTEISQPNRTSLRFRGRRQQSVYSLVSDGVENSSTNLEVEYVALSSNFFEVSSTKKLRRIRRHRQNNGKFTYIAKPNFTLYVRQSASKWLSGGRFSCGQTCHLVLKIQSN